MRGVTCKVFLLVGLAVLALPGVTLAQGGCQKCQEDEILDGPHWFDGVGTHFQCSPPCHLDQFVGQCKHYHSGECGVSEEELDQLALAVEQGEIRDVDVLLSELDGVDVTVADESTLALRCAVNGTLLARVELPPDVLRLLVLDAVEPG